MNKNTFLSVAGSILLIYMLFKKKSKYIVIGDSQTPYIAKASNKYELLNVVPGVNSLWLGGTNVNWLINALKLQKPQYNVGGVAISIGTNGGFNLNDNITELKTELKRVFPLAKFYAVPGSWGWGGNINKNINDVINYYNKFKTFATVLNTPIGQNDPHANLPSYNKIAIELDK